MLAQARILSDITFKVNNVLVNVEININVNQCFIGIVHWIYVVDFLLAIWQTDFIRYTLC